MKFLLFCSISIFIFIVNPNSSLVIRTFALGRSSAIILSNDEDTIAEEDEGNDPNIITPDLEYWTVTTTDNKGNKASVGGGMMKRQNPQQQITNFIDVKSVDEYSSKVEKLGGKVVVSKMALPGMGYFAVCHDTENNSFGI
jgi:hypothetical protein